MKRIYNKIGARTFGLNFVKKSEKSEKIYYVDIPAGASVGRVICETIRTYKKLTLEGKAPRVLAFFGVEDATITGDIKPLVQKYKSRANGGTLFRGGPLYPRETSGFFKRIFRGMLKYKLSGKDLFNSLLIEPKGTVKEKVLKGQALELKLKILKWHSRVSLKELVSHL